MDNVINLCFACDENYVQHLNVALTSLYINKEKDDFFNIIILDDGLSKKSQTNIKNISQNFANINFIQINNNLFKDCPLTEDASHINSLSTYYRFLLSSICNYDKILYLDCDIVVKHSLRNLYNIDISEVYFAGVEDVYCKENCERLQLVKYCNAGIMLINLKKWRDENIEQQLFKYCLENQEKIKWQDQDVLNVVLQTKIKYLPVEFNTQVSEIEFGKTKEHNKLILQSTIIHYIGSQKPWSYPSFSLLTRDYYRYLIFTKYKYLIFKYLFCALKNTLLRLKKKIIRIKFSSKESYIYFFGKYLYKNRENSNED